MNFKIGTYIQQGFISWLRDPIFEKIGQRFRSQRHIMYVAKICLNSVPGGPINFILGGLTLGRPPPLQVGHKTVAMATLVFN